MDNQSNAKGAITESPAATVATTPSGTAYPDIAQKTSLIERFITGHPPGFWFFFWGELAERSSYYGMRAILFLYMADVLGFGPDNAGSIMMLFIAACYFLPLVGGFLADNFFGKYWTIVGFSLPYIFGQLLLCIDAKNYFGFSEAGYVTFSRIFLFVSLLLLAMGSGVIKPNISTLMGLTYDQTRPGRTQLRSDAFSFFYMAINIGAFLSSFAMPRLRDLYGYHIAFLLPAVLMPVALTLFALGKPFYARETITRTRTTPEERRQQWAVLGRLFGVFATITFFWLVFDQSTTTWIRFAQEDFDLNFGIDLPWLGDKFAPDQFQALNPLLIVVLLPFISVGLWRLLARVGFEMRATDKMLVGFVLTAASMAVMAVAGYFAWKGEKVSIWWQVGTYFLITVAELCISPVGLELAFTAAPKAMKGFITACFLATVFIAALLNSVVVRLYTPMGPALFFATMTSLMVVITVVFVLVAQRFNRAMARRKEEEIALALPTTAPASEAVTAQSPAGFRQEKSS